MDEQTKYFCWKAKHEDITAQVEACIRSKGSVKINVDVGAPATDAELARNTCAVYCSEGHLNVFPVEDA